MTTEPFTVAFDGELSSPSGLPDALRATIAGTAGPDDIRLLQSLGLLEDGGLVEDLQPIAEAIAAPVLTLGIRLCLRGVAVQGRGWLQRDQAVMIVPESTSQDASVRLVCFATARLPHTLARFLALGPRPDRESMGALLVEQAVLERLAGSGTSVTAARLELKLDDPDSDETVAALCTPGALHWRLDVQDAATGGEVFSRSTEAVDADDAGLWLVGPSADERLVLVVPASTTMMWRLLTTMLPTQYETEAILAAQASESARNSNPVSANRHS